MRSNRFLYLVIFVSGMTTLAIEMTASRLLGSIYGTSNLIWANVIGLILLYLTAGYFLGGWWADRSPHRQTLYRILIWGAFLSALVPLVSRPILAEAARAFAGLEAGLILGSFVSVLVLFAVPITLFGTASPFAIRLAVSDVNSAGKTSGRIYAISTLGSLIGTFLPALLIIPELGTFGTFMLFSGLLYTVCMIGLWREQPRSALRLAWMPAVVAGLAVFVMSQPIRAAAEGSTILYETESGYNYIQVQEDSAGNRYLYLNEGQGVHSRYHPTIYGYGQTWDFFLAAPYFNAPPFEPSQVESLAVIGLAAGTIPRQYTHVYGAIPIDGIEIDGRIIDVGRAFFEMTMPNLTAYADDGRFRLNRLSRRYTVIAIDAYRPPYIPWHLTTVEFFQEVRDKLTDNGVVAINVGRTNTDRRLVEALTATLLEVFPSVHTMDVPLSFNTILIATRQPTSAENLERNLAALPQDAAPLLRDTLALAVGALVPTQRGDLVFTDNRAPVETLVDSLVINFLLSGGTDQLRRN
jgi:spermidine synthase